MKYIDWNQMSELGLIERINKEMLHPLGLTISRNPANGVSDAIFVADDKYYEYDPAIELKPVLSKDEIHQRLESMEIKGS